MNISIVENEPIISWEKLSVVNFLGGKLSVVNLPSGKVSGRYFIEKRTVFLGGKLSVVNSNSTGVIFQKIPP